jgi:uncharacterized protein involved in exopolysaccharide biosynthesis
VLKRLWLIILLVIITVATAGVASWVQPLAYRTMLRFQVSATPPTDVSLYPATRSGVSPQDVATTRANFIEVLTSLEVAWRTVDSLELPMTGRDLLDRVRIEESAESDFVRMSVTAADPTQAADIANTLIQAAIVTYGELNARPLTVAREFIAGQILQTQTELTDARARLVAFQVTNNMGTLDSAVEAQVSLIRSLQLAHDQALANGELAEAQGYESQIATRQLELIDMIQLSGEYTTLETRVDQLQSTYGFLLEKMTEARLKENQALNLDFVQVLDSARVPDAPEPRLNLAVMALSGTVAAVLGVMLAFVAEALEQRRAAARRPEALPRAAPTVARRPNLEL